MVMLAIASVLSSHSSLFPEQIQQVIILGLTIIYINYEVEEHPVYTCNESVWDLFAIMN